MAAANPDEQRQAREIENEWRLDPRYKRRRLGTGGYGIAEHFAVDKGQAGDSLTPGKDC